MLISPPPNKDPFSVIQNEDELATLTPEQERLMKLVYMDLEQLASRASSVPDSKYKSSFISSLDLAREWFKKAVAPSSSLSATNQENQDE